MKRFKEKLIESKEFSEIDLEYPFYENDERNEVEMPNEEIWYDTESMSIDDAILTLEHLKEKGADRVYIVAHSDHHGYIFTGVKLEEL